MIGPALRARLLTPLTPASYLAWAPQQSDAHHPPVLEATVRIARSVTRMAPMLGAVSFALFLVGCADNATAPAILKAPTGVASERKIDLTKRKNLTATTRRSSLPGTSRAEWSRGAWLRAG